MAHGHGCSATKTGFKQESRNLRILGLRRCRRDREAKCVIHPHPEAVPRSVIVRAQPHVFAILAVGTMPG